MYLAQRGPTPGTETVCSDPADPTTCVATIKGFEWIFYNVVSVVLGLAGIALFIMLIIGGFKYLTSGGNPETAQSAQKTITYALLGLVLIALAYLIILFIQTFTGANLSTFRITQ